MTAPTILCPARDDLGGMCSRDEHSSLGFLSRRDAERVAETVRTD